MQYGFNHVMMDSRGPFMRIEHEMQGLELARHPCDLNGKPNHDNGSCVKRVPKMGMPTPVLHERG